MNGNNWWAWLLGLALIAAGVVLGLTAPRQNPAENARFADPEKPSTEQKVVVALNRPVVTAFVGDLLDGGKKRRRGPLVPFVIGEQITLEAEAQNATEYRWTVDGVALPDDKGQEWSAKNKREYVIPRAGVVKFGAQVRDKEQVSQIKETSLTTAALAVEGFEPYIAETWDERVLTGYDYTVEVDIEDPQFTEVDDYYRFRYLVNDRPVMNPDDATEDEDHDGEWCREKRLTYTFPGPGHYSFKVEVRRYNSKVVEDTRELLEPIIVADALLLEFGADPENSALVGTPVTLSAWPYSNTGVSQCRFGVKKLGTAEFKWLEEDGLDWNSDKRIWLPSEPGIYELRAEVRELGKGEAQDFRQIQYVVKDDDF
jgi:hypothetical protein